MEIEALEQELRVLEERLAMPERGESRDSLAALLATDFRQFGCSGIHTRESTLQALSSGRLRPRVAFEDFHAARVAPDTVLVTYVSRSVAGPGWKPPALRASVWVWRDARWQLVFHQGSRFSLGSET